MEDNIFDKLREATGKLPDKLNILEEQIDVKVQMEFFKYLKKDKKNQSKEEPIDVDNIPELNLDELTIDDKKEILVQLAGIDDAKAFRSIEEFFKNAPVELKDWATLALQQSKMLLESSLLDESQVYISTGLGGKGNMLRYFVVLIGEGIDEFENFQQKIVSSEFEYALKKNNCELESIEFQENFTTFMALIPFEVAFQNIFRLALEECNQYGSFLKPNFMVTNVKALSIQEIKDFVEKSEHPIKGDLEFDELDENIGFTNNEIDDIFKDDDELDDEIDELDDEE